MTGCDLTLTNRTDAEDPVMTCAECNWTGKRSVRVVAWCSEHKQYVCSRCFLYRGKC
jgi:hypothetical protein